MGYDEVSERKEREARTRAKEQGDFENREVGSERVQRRLGTHLEV